MAEKSRDCYIDVWRDADFRGEKRRIHGPAEFPTLAFAEGDWGKDIGSLRVGPNAFVMAYHRRDFHDRLITFGPFDECADLSVFKSDDEIASLKVIDSLKIFDRVGYNNTPDPNVSNVSDAPPPDTAEPAPGGGVARPNPNKGKRWKGRKR